jgi:hypothetical protein
MKRQRRDVMLERSTHQLINELNCADFGCLKICISYTRGFVN